MPTLDHMLKHKIRMLDYEKIIDEKGARQVAFGVKFYINTELYLNNKY